MFLVAVAAGTELDGACMALTVQEMQLKMVNVMAVHVLIGPNGLNGRNAQLPAELAKSSAKETVSTAWVQTVKVLTMKQNTARMHPAQSGSNGEAGVTVVSHVGLE